MGYYEHLQRESESYYSEKISYQIKLISREKPEYNTERFTVQWLS